MISIVIPTYEMNGRGEEMLRRCLNSIAAQNYNDIEVVIADNSDNDDIYDICAEYMREMLVMYYHNPNKGATRNTNFGIKLAQGEIIKILNQDDYLSHENVLIEIAENFTGQWMIVGCDNNPNPYYTGDIHQGNNKLGGPSALVIANEHPMLFDEDMRWLFDCDYYKRMYMQYGEPLILKGVYVNIGTGDHQLTNQLSQSAKEAEVVFMTNKYAR